MPGNKHGQCAPSAALWADEDYDEQVDERRMVEDHVFGYQTIKITVVGNHIKGNGTPDNLEQVCEGRLAAPSLRLRAEGDGGEGGEGPVPLHDEGPVLPQVSGVGQVN